MSCKQFYNAKKWRFFSCLFSHCQILILTLGWNITQKCSWLMGDFMTIHPALIHFLFLLWARVNLVFYFSSTLPSIPSSSCLSLTSYVLVRLLPPSLSIYRFFPDPLFLTFTVLFFTYRNPSLHLPGHFPVPISLSLSLSLLSSHFPCILLFHPLHISLLFLMRACSAVIIRAEVGWWESA